MLQVKPFPSTIPALHAGLDIGSTGTKAALLHAQTREVLAVAEEPTGWEPDKAAQNVLNTALGHLGGTLQHIAGTVATGYGRASVPQAAKRVTEITCHARGALHLVAGARTVLDIGGQDSKLIALAEDGSVRDFLMNDKCAAGTGRFVANMAMALGIPLDDFGSLAAQGSPAPLSSMCAVFAETEIIGLTTQGAERQDLAAGIVASIAKRLKALAGRIPFVPVVAFTGGLARNVELIDCFQRALGVELTAPPLAPYAGAVGAALIAADCASISSTPSPGVSA